MNQQIQNPVSEDEDPHPLTAEAIASDLASAFVERVYCNQVRQELKKQQFRGTVDRRLKNAVILVDAYQSLMNRIVADLGLSSDEVARQAHDWVTMETTTPKPAAATPPPAPVSPPPVEEKHVPMEHFNPIAGHLAFGGSSRRRSDATSEEATEARRRSQNVGGIQSGGGVGRVGVDVGRPDVTRAEQNFMDAAGSKFKASRANANKRPQNDDDED